jgi:hypothetical protein
MCTGLEEERFARPACHIASLPQHAVAILASFGNQHVANNHKTGALRRGGCSDCNNSSELLAVRTLGSLRDHHVGQVQ